jgi:hypothetical protein
MVSAASRPTLAKNARMGHPRFRYGKEEQRVEGWAAHHAGDRKENFLCPKKLKNTTTTISRAPAM